MNATLSRVQTFNALVVVFVSFISSYEFHGLFPHSLFKYVSFTEIKRTFFFHAGERTKLIFSLVRLDEAVYGCSLLFDSCKLR